MGQIPYIFNQLVSFLPKDYFDRLVKKYNGNAYVKNYSCWNHLLVMIWAQLTGRRSLRDIETSLRAHSDKTYRMGIGAAICRSNIAKANATRDVAIFRELSQEMMRKASGMNVKDETLENIARTFHLAGFFAIDSSTVSLKLSRFTWSEPQEGYGGVKLHTMYDIMRKVPRLCNITGHEECDQTFMEDYAYESGCFYLLDRMYFKTRGMHRINSAGAFFITRMKRNVVYEVLAEAGINGVHVLSDQAIRFTSRWASLGYPGRLRLIKYYSAENNEVLSFVTNNFVLDAATIALLYRFRWEIECFFKWIKQHLRIIAFYGTSANAVMIQIYTALTAFCMLAMAADAYCYKRSLYEFSNLMSVSLTDKTLLSDLIKRSESANFPCIINQEPTLFDFDNLIG